MKRQDLYNLLNGFELVKDLKGVKFAYARAKNKKLVLAELELLKDITKDSDEFIEYDKKRVELCKIYCEKDDKGNDIIKNNKFEGLKENKKFIKKLDELNEQFKKTIDEKKSHAEEYKKLLNEEIDFEFHRIKLEDVPEDITGAQLESIDSILEENK